MDFETTKVHVGTYKGLTYLHFANKYNLIYAFELVSHQCDLIWCYWSQLVGHSSVPINAILDL